MSETTLTELLPADLSKLDLALMADGVNFNFTEWCCIVALGIGPIRWAGGGVNLTAAHADAPRRD